MIEVLAAYVVGMAQVGPNLLQVQYLNEDHQIITVTEVMSDQSGDPD